MPTFIVVHQETGEIVHAHVEPDEARTHERNVLEHVDPAHDRAQLRVVRVEDGTFREGLLYRFDPDSERLEEVEDAPGFGGGSLQGAGTPPPSARVEYRPEGRS